MTDPGALAGPRAREKSIRDIQNSISMDWLPDVCVTAVKDRSLRVRHVAREGLDAACKRMGTDLTLQALQGVIPIRPLVEGLASQHKPTQEWCSSIINPAALAQRIREGGFGRDRLTELASGRSGMTVVGWWSSVVLIELGDRAGIVSLCHGLRVGSDRVRHWLMRAVGEIGYLRLVNFLCECLDDRSAQLRLRRSSALALGPLGHPAALPSLTGKSRFWTFEDGDLKDSCRTAIRQIRERGLDVLPISTSHSAPGTESLPRPTSLQTSTEASLPRPAGVNENGEEED